MNKEKTSDEQKIIDKIAEEILIYLKATPTPTIVFSKIALCGVDNLTYEPVFFNNITDLNNCINKIKKEMSEITVKEWC